jgi:hypothetical protein
MDSRDCPGPSERNGLGIDRRKRHGRKPRMPFANLNCRTFRRPQLRRWPRSKHPRAEILMNRRPTRAGHSVPMGIMAREGRRRL